jgi:phosphoesterase RecJ-like protein
MGSVLMDKILKNISNIISSSNNQSFLLLLHSSPDGDALGSALALKLLLETYYNKSVQIYSKDKIPYKYLFLPNIESVKIEQNLPSNIDVTIVLESANIMRTGYLSENLKTKTIINIDHHKTNDLYGDINWVDSEKSAVCEMIYLIYKFLNKEINKNIATCLYVGILTDTGRFQYSNMKPDVYDILKELVSKGLDVNYIYKEIYSRRPKSYINFMRILLDSIEFYCNEQLAISYIDSDLIEKFALSSDDMDGASEYLRSIDNVEISVFIKPKKNGIYKFSLRSKGKIKIDKLCNSFGGGGHIYAAGFDIKAKNAHKAKDMVLDKIKELF